MQIYEKIHLLQCTSGPYQDKFTLKSNRLNIPFLSELPNESVSSMMLYIISRLGPSVPEYNASLNKVNKLDYFESIIDCMTVDLSQLACDINRRTFYKGLNPLIAEGFVFRLEYHGHRYIVNPYRFNRLNDKQCRSITNIILEIDRQVRQS